MELTNPAWTFLSFVTTVIGIVLSTTFTILYFRKQNQKAMAYELLSDEAMQIETGNTLIDARSINIRIWNSGEAPILENDHCDSIKFCFGPNAQVRKVSVLQTDPPGINVNPKPQGNNLVLEKPIRTLNKKDSVTLTVQVVQFSGKVDPVCCIAGVKKIHESPQFLKGSIRFCTLLTVGFLTYFILTTLLFSLPQEQINYQNIDIVSVLVLWLLWLIRVFRWKLKIVFVILKSFKYVLPLLIGYMCLRYLVLFVLFYIFKIIHAH